MKNRKDKPRKVKTKFVDDGRVVANMNVDGMPWYHPQAKNHKGNKVEKAVTLSRKEKMAMTRGVLAAALLVGVIFLVVFGLFILFCVKVWFA